MNIIRLSKLLNHKFIKEEIPMFNPGSTLEQDLIIFENIIHSIIGKGNVYYQQREAIMRQTQDIHMWTDNLLDEGKKIFHNHESYT